MRLSLPWRRSALRPLWEQFQRDHETTKTIYYFSCEYLPGGQTRTLLKAAEFYRQICDALNELGYDAQAVILEDGGEPALGNGGLGRLASCFLTSMATCGVPSIGYGIKYTEGFQDQSFDWTGAPVVRPHHWEKDGPNPHYFLKATPFTVRFFGQYQNGGDDHRWVNATVVDAHRWDGMIPGRKVDDEDHPIINTNRLFSVRHMGDAYDARKNWLLSGISKILYPPDSTDDEKLQCLCQQYFFTSLGIKDVIATHLKHHASLANLADEKILHFNDTHPVIGIAELMRLLVDGPDDDMIQAGITYPKMGWTEAKAIMQTACRFTNHTKMQEALETWPGADPERGGNFTEVLPRHARIIGRLNQDVMDEVSLPAKQHAETLALIAGLTTGPGKTYPVGALEKIARRQEERAKELEAIRGDVKIVNDKGHVHMARMAVANVPTNGVSEMHGQILAEETFPAFVTLYGPKRITFIVNGADHHRWMGDANEPLCDFLSEAVGSRRWMKDPACLAEELEPYKHDRNFHSRLMDIRRHGTEHLLERIAALSNAPSVFAPDVMVTAMFKRFHGYKRQLMSLIHTYELYRKRLGSPHDSHQPVFEIYAGKAAATYTYANKTIKLANWMAWRMNVNRPLDDGSVQTFLIPNYNVSWAESLIKGIYLHKQIPLAGYEAAGTSNIKCAMNGALPINTLDGANVDIVNAAGEENVFLFGLRSDQVRAYREPDAYKAHEFFARDPELVETLSDLHSALLITGATDLAEFIDDLRRGNDHWMIAADFAGYRQQFARAVNVYRDPDVQGRMMVANIGAGGGLSSDRSIRDGYAPQIWDIPAYGGLPKPASAQRPARVNIASTSDMAAVLAAMPPQEALQYRL